MAGGLIVSTVHTEVMTRFYSFCYSDLSFDVFWVFLPSSFIAPFVEERIIILRLVGFSFFIAGRVFIDSTKI